VISDLPAPAMSIVFKSCYLDVCLSDDHGCVRWSLVFCGHYVIDPSNAMASRGVE